MAVTDLVITDFAHEVIAWGHASSSTKELETLYKMDAHSFTAQIFVEFNSLPVQTSTCGKNSTKKIRSKADSPAFGEFHSKKKNSANFPVQTSKFNLTKKIRRRKFARVYGA